MQKLHLKARIVTLNYNGEEMLAKCLPGAVQLFLDRSAGFQYAILSSYFYVFQKYWRYWKRL